MSHPNALGRHVALIGFMGAGKSTLAAEVAGRIGREAIDLDELLEGRTQLTVSSFFAQRGETEFRILEAAITREVLRTSEPAVLALGGGALGTPEVRAALAEHALTVLVDTDVDSAWRRSHGTGRPLAQDEQTFRRLYDERDDVYRRAADAVVGTGDADGVVLAAAGIHYRSGSVARLGELVPGDGPVALISDPIVLGLHGAAASGGLGDRLRSTHLVPAGEDAKQARILEQIWSELRLDRSATIVGFGGGCVTDVAGFVAATYLRGIPWVSVPTTLVGQVDAGIGGKTAIDLPEGKNLVGAFHWPQRVVIDEALLSTLPERERRQGVAELVKTQLLAGRELEARGAAAYKAGLCLRDPEDRGDRRFLNLGHTFAHALEAAADFELSHGDAVALGLIAALELSGRDTAPVIDALAPQRVRVDRERAWSALLRDKKRDDSRINLVLLGDDGPVVREVLDLEVRAALDSLIAD
jgi:shikimate kinase / 3-dehydroquinate synthase